MRTEVPSFEEKLEQSGLTPFTAHGIAVFQMNLGLRCNQACKHCHVAASPERTEMMADGTMDACIKAVTDSGIPVVDITGGAPELHPRYRQLVETFHGAGRKVITRCNLTIFQEEGYADLPEFYKANGVEVVASLPYYRERETDRTRGHGVFNKSIEGLKRLNELGYGMEGSGLFLNLAYNPAGAFFPPPQAALEAEFKKELGGKHGVTFNHLFTMVNMPIGRFAEFLKRTGNLRSYLKKLVDVYNPAAAENAMCRTTLSVNWQGFLYDCDFNQMLDMKVNHGAPSHIKDFNPAELEKREIVTGPHCYGCSAGSGSSCGGATA